VQLVPVLAQAAEPVRRYVEETGLPFNVLIDDTRDVARAYGVYHRIALDAWNTARPSVFLIGQDARIRYSYVSENQREYPGPDEILRIVDEMQRADKPAP
jgi:methyl-accepting chemotaxis protein